MKDAPDRPTRQPAYAIRFSPLTGAPAADASCPPRASAAIGNSALYIYRWDRGGRKGQRCRLFARGMMNSVGLAFEERVQDGHLWQCAEEGLSHAARAPR